MATIATLMVKLGLDSAAFADGLRKAQGQLQSAGKKMSNVGKSLTAGVTLPIVGIGVAALKSAADFEQSMNILQVVSGATSAEMEQLSAQAIQVGKDSVFSAGEVATAQLNLAKAGMNVNAVMDATAGVISLAAAADTDLATAADVTANAINAFSLEASEAGRVSDLLAAASNASSASMTDLIMGLQQGGFAFAAGNQKIDDLAASLAILTNVGLTGSDAGTALKNMFMRLIAPTDAAGKWLDYLGVSAFDAEGNMSSLSDIIGMLDAGMANMTQEERLFALETIFMNDGMKAMIPLLDQGVSGFEAMKAKVNQAGAASDTANARMKGLAGAVEYFKGTLDTMMISGATPWLEMLGSLIRGAADLIAKFGELPAPVQKGIVIFLAVIAAVGPLLVIFGTLISSIGTIVGALALVSGPVWLIIAAVAALAIAFTTNFMGIRDMTMSVVGAVQGLIMDLVAGNISAGDALAAAWSKIKEVGTRSFGLLVDYLKTQWPIWRATLANWATAAWTWIVESAPILLTKAGEFVMGLLRFLANQIPNVLAMMVRYATALVEWIGNSQSPVNSSLGEWIGNVLEWGLGTALPMLLDMSLKFAGALISWIATDLIPKLGPELLKFGLALVKALSNIAASLASAALDIGAGIIGGIVKGINNGVAAIANAAKNVALGALDAAKWALGINSPSTVAADEVGEPFGEGIGIGAGRAIDDIMGMLGSRLDALVGGLQPTPGFAGDGVGAGGGMTIQVTQNFYGNADAATVEAASKNGVVAALRQVGVR